MTRSTAWFVHVAVASVAATGVVYGWMCYFAVSDDPFAVANHPLQPTLQTLHILFAPLLVFAVGLLWRSHVWGKWRSRRPHRRRSGIALALLFVPMAASGYLLQVAVDETWRLGWIWVHGVSSCAWTLVYVGHQCVRPANGARRVTANGKAGP